MWLGAGVVGLFMVDALLAGAGAYDWGDGARLILGVSSALGMLAAIASLVYGARALRRGDRSIVLIGPLFLGAMALVFVVGEFAFPH